MTRASKVRQGASSPYAVRPLTSQQRVLHALPGLCLEVRCRPQGVVVTACLHKLMPDGRRGVETIADVTFRPREVTEQLVLQWAIGALSTYLGRKAEAAAEAVVDPT